MPVWVFVNMSLAIFLRAVYIVPITQMLYCAFVNSPVFKHFGDVNPSDQLNPIIDGTQ